MRSLLRQAADETSRFPDGAYPAISKYHKLQNGLSALRSSAERGCEMCMLIWETAVRTLGADQVHRWREKGKGEGEQQIYLGTSEWSPSLQGLPHVVATQTLPDGAPWPGLRTLGSFEVFAERDNVPEIDGHLLARNVYPDPASEDCLGVAAEWLHTCVKTHKNCPKPRRTSLPTRVIDVGPPDGSQKPYVLISNGKLADWVALTYCWGGRSSFVLRKDTPKLYRPDASLNFFPGTIRDAIIITRKLEIRYLWVDALCIIQDSHDDWAYESARMRDVYKEALVTIAAADSPTASHGIFHQRPSPERTCQIPWGGSSEQYVFMRPGTHLWDETMRSSPLNTRGWTLQESLLAPRTISYGPQQMFWECPSCQTDEGGRTTEPTQSYRGKRFFQDMVRSMGSANAKTWRNLLGLGPSRTPSTSTHDRWLDIVFQYTGRRLTNDTDVLPALSGLAMEFQRLTGDTYLAGLWQKDLVRGLLWDRFPLSTAELNGDFEGEKPSAYRAPSWSWASINGQHVSFTGHGPSKRPGVIEKEAKVLKVEVIPAGPDPFGQLCAGALTLKAPFQMIGDFRRPEMTSTTYPKLEALMKQWWKDVRSFQWAFLQAHEDCPDQHFGLVEVLRWTASPGSQIPGVEFLLVESTGNKAEYRRLWHPQLRKMQSPREEEGSGGLYKSTVDELAAWEEVESIKWKARNVVIV